MDHGLWTLQKQHFVTYQTIALKMPNNQSRRKVLKNLVAGTAVLGSAGILSSFHSNEEKTNSTLKGNINHSVCRWCYGSIPLEEFCASAKKMGIKAVDLVGP